jgi:hypothetical protein
MIGMAMRSCEVRSVGGGGDCCALLAYMYSVRADVGCHCVIDTLLTKIVVFVIACIGPNFSRGMPETSLFKVDAGGMVARANATTCNDDAKYPPPSASHRAPHGQLSDLYIYDASSAHRKRLEIPSATGTSSASASSVCEGSIMTCS